ncbi:MULTISPECIES: universal stress protein [Actinomycetes]|uniref:universal stress protein n=1 Tax=Actinomycetes TaxID=1760 RepID=UPI0004C23BE1
MGRHDLRLAVGVDGGPGSMAAVRWAASVVDRRGGSLLLARGYVPQSLLLLMGGHGLKQLRDSEQQMLDAVAEAIRDEFSGVIVETLVESVAAAPLLIGLAESVDGLVVGRNRANWVERVTLGGISSEVSARARCPVVTVPSDTKECQGPVVVPFDCKAPAERVMEVAFTWARDSGRELVFVHAVQEDISTENLSAIYDRALAAVSSWSARYPTCNTRVQLVNGDAERALVEAVPHASLWIVNRPRVGRPLTAWSPFTPRVIHRRAACPVLVVGCT